MLKQRTPSIYNILLSLRKNFYKGNIRQKIHLFTKGHILRYLIIKSFLNTNKRYLQVGGGHHTIKSKGWLNADIIAGDIYLDATKKLPFPDKSIDIIFTEQFIEHLSQKDAINFIHECFRVLKPNGIIRQSTPDLDKIISLHMGTNEIVSIDKVMDRHIKNHRSKDEYILNNSCQFFNDIFRLWGHQYIYDYETLSKIHINAGFKKVQKFGESDNDILIGLERHAEIEWMKNGFSLIVEVIKLSDEK